MNREINFKNLTWRKGKVYELIADYIFILSEKQKMLFNKGLWQKFP